MILNYKNFLNENLSGTTTTPVSTQPAQVTTINSNGGGTQITTAQSGTTQTQRPQVTGTTTQVQLTGTTQTQQPQITGTTQVQSTGATQTETSNEILDPEVIKANMKNHIDKFIEKTKLSKPTPVQTTT